MNTLAVESKKALQAVDWMNSHARQNGLKFEARLEGYTLSTNSFGQFEVISWKGDWSAALELISKASRKLNIKVIEASKGEDPFESFFKRTAIGKLYSNGKHVAKVQLQRKSGKWSIKSEKLE